MAQPSVAIAMTGRPVARAEGFASFGALVSELHCVGQLTNVKKKLVRFATVGVLHSWPFGTVGWPRPETVQRP